MGHCALHFRIRSLAPLSNVRFQEDDRSSGWSAACSAARHRNANKNSAKILEVENRTSQPMR